MFIDYYHLLEIHENATQEDVKNAFRKQALKWHPDRNRGSDTKKRMQEINEAYLILKDSEARARYNIEYRHFRKTQQQEQLQQEPQKSREGQDKQSHQQNSNSEYYHYPNYNFQDDILNKWINNARNQAIELAKQTIEDFKGMASAGIKAAAQGAGYQLIAQIAIAIIFILFFTLTQNCGN